MENNKKKKFKLFDLNRDGKGVEEENRKPTLGFFFKSFFRKFSNLLRLNLLMLPQIFAIIIFAVICIPPVESVVLYFLGAKTPSATSVLFAPLYGINQSSVLPDASVLLDVSSIQMGLPRYSPVIIYIALGIFLFLAITWGWQNVGATYVLRGLVRGEPVFVFSDFFYGIKKNLKQGFFIGLLDFAVCCILVIDIRFIWTQPTEAFGSYFMAIIVSAGITAVALIYFMMRFYIYLLLITFDIKTLKLLKNAFIFSVLGILRNIMALLGIALFTLLHAFLIYLGLGVGFSLPILLPFIYFMASTAFMSAYAAYPVIDKYMIEPYADDKDEEEFIYLKPNDDSADE